MENNNNILSRVKLLMNYELGKTLEENYKSIGDDLLMEQPILGRIFKIAGKELVGELRPALEDVVRIFRQSGGVEIKAADGSITKAATADELIDALHAGRVSANTIGEVYTGLLRSSKTDVGVIEHILQGKGFETKFNQVYGSLKNQPDEIRRILKTKGFPDTTIDKMFDRMNIVHNAAGAGASAGSNINNVLNNLLGQSGSNLQSVEDIMKSFNKTYGLKLSDSEINQIVKDSTKTIEQSLAKTNVPQTMDEVLKTINAMTDKQVEELIKKVRMSQPPGITQSVWSSIVDSFVSSGKNTNKLAANSGQSVGKWAMNGIFSIYKKGLTLAIFYQGGKFLLNPLVPNDTNTVSELAKRSLLWPIYFWKGLKDTESTIQTSLQAPSTSLDAGGKMNYGTNPSQPSQTTTQTSSPELFKKGEFDN